MPNSPATPTSAGRSATASSRGSISCSPTPAGPDAYVEVKNVHLSRRKGLSEFPDSVTARGAKHLAELSAMVAAGHRAVMLFLIQRGDTSAFALARDIDPAYAAAFDRAAAAGVEMLAYRCRVDLDGDRGRRPDSDSWLRAGCGALRSWPKAAISCG